MTERKIQIRIVGPSSGSVTKRSDSQLDAPSIAAASCSSSGTPCRPARKQDDREADVLPRDHDEERVEDEPQVGEPELHEPAETDAPQRRVDEPVRLEDLQEENGGDRLREDVRREEDQPEDAAPAERPVEQQRDAERERELQADRERDEDRVVPHRLPEGGVAERLAVVVEPDEVGQRHRDRSTNRSCSGRPGRPERSGRCSRARSPARGRARSRATCAWSAQRPAARGRAAGRCNGSARHRPTSASRRSRSGR